MLPAALLQGTSSEVVNSQATYYGGATFWFSLTLLNAGLAQLHGRSGLAWFLVSLFLGPIATLILVLQYKKA
ncbi:MAG TPA: antitermination protein NusB [Candidatus Dormibacteraeota bacterium]|nr:antitermination protein NusB [Candidatus Dormibacteraeota bacterium]